MATIGGYPHSYYVVGVAIIAGCAGLGGLVAALIGADGWVGGVISIGGLILGFAVARRVNARLFGRIRTD